jgi:ATP-dependent DNA helicase RecG
MLKRRLDSRLLKTRDNYIDKLKRMGIETLHDLFFNFPRTYKDEQNFTLINDMQIDEVNVIQGKIKSLFNMRTKRGKTLTKALVEDSTGQVEVMWFNQPHIKQMFFKGGQIILTGKVKLERGKLHMSSPSYEKPSKVLLHTGRIVPVYSESEEISSMWLRKKIYSFLAYTDYIQETLPDWLLEKEGLMPLPMAISQIHFPKSSEHLDKAKERIAFEELLVLQLMALKRKAKWQESYNRENIDIDSDLSDFLYELPFTLTGAQERVIGEIIFDMQKDVPMLRLVQGDVGAGKTAVAAAAIFVMHKNKAQSALMAPTEILARQHYKGLMKLLAPFQLNIQLLVGSMTMKERQDVLRQMASGTCDLVIGTHALIQEGVSFAKLGLVVVDEQHRFGVKQRNVFKMHGSPHMLNLSATPIPRTLALTVYGDQDISILDEMPPGRQEIVTRIVPEKKRDDAYHWIRDQIGKGRQVFIICPLVEESEAIQVKSATEEYERLCRDVFTDERLALLHGKMKAEQKDAVMKSFSDGDIDILVSTSVVEVGIDVPNATIMLIEGAERFGLAQLHQFRGRVGRGKHQSYCFLFSDSSGEDSRKRLNYMVQHSSGFDLAEFDLELRGPGEVFGVKQSGIPDLRMANIMDVEMLTRVRSVAEYILQKDFDLDHVPYIKNKVIEKL